MGAFRRRVVAGREAGIADSFEPSIFVPGGWQARGVRRRIEGSTLACPPVAISVNHRLNESRKELSTLSGSNCKSTLRRTTEEFLEW